MTRKASRPHSSEGFLFFSLIPRRYDTLHNSPIAWYHSFNEPYQLSIDEKECTATMTTPTSPSYLSAILALSLVVSGGALIAHDVVQKEHINQASHDIHHIMTVKDEGILKLSPWNRTYLKELQEAAQEERNEAYQDELVAYRGAIAYAQDYEFTTPAGYVDRSKIDEKLELDSEYAWIISSKHRLEKLLDDADDFTKTRSELDPESIDTHDNNTLGHLKSNLTDYLAISDNKTTSYQELIDATEDIETLEALTFTDVYADQTATLNDAKTEKLNILIAKRAEEQARQARLLKQKSNRSTTSHSSTSYKSSSGSKSSSRSSGVSVDGRGIARGGQAKIDARTGEWVSYGSVGTKQHGDGKSLYLAAHNDSIGSSIKNKSSISYTDSSGNTKTYKKVNTVGGLVAGNQFPSSLANIVSGSGGDVIAFQTCDSNAKNSKSTAYIFEEVK